MNAAAKEISTLKLTAAEDGSVWYLDGAGLPAAAGMDAPLFLKSPVLKRTSRVRVVGTAGNAGLIVALYKARETGDIQSLEVCSPLVCESPEGRKDPELTLFYMRTFSLAPSLGGWHAATAADRAAYGIADIVRRENEVTPEAMALAESHPVWPALLFVHGLDRLSAARLIGTVIDPRWYIDQDEPNRGGRLEQYLGLNPKTMRAVVEGRAGSWLHDRCRLVKKCWSEAAIETVDRSCGKSTGVVARLKADPRLFLWRICASKESHDRGYLAASKKFVSYVRHNWLDVLASPAQRGRLFVPKHFFETPAEAEAYKDHMALLRRTRAK